MNKLFAMAIFCGLSCVATQLFALPPTVGYFSVGNQCGCGNSKVTFPSVTGGLANSRSAPQTAYAYPRSAAALFAMQRQAFTAAKVMQRNQRRAIAKAQHDKAQLAKAQLAKGQEKGVFAARPAAGKRPQADQLLAKAQQ